MRKQRRTTRLAALGLAVVALGLGAAACGGDDGDDGAATATETTETNGATTLAGREIFVANCGSCHTLSDAGATGTIGPSLDQINLSTEEIAEQVTNGGGAMPAFGDQLSEAEIDQVAEYVAGS